MATVDKIKRELHIEDGLVTLKKSTTTILLRDVEVDLEEGEYEEGEPDYALVQEEAYPIGSNTEMFYLEPEDLTNLSAFISHVKGLCPDMNTTFHYYTTDSFKSISVLDDTVTFLGDIEDEIIENLALVSTCRWTVNHDPDSEYGEFFCPEYEALVLEMEANGRSERKVPVVVDQDTLNRKKLANYYDRLPADQVTQFTSSRGGEIMANAELTTEELAILATLD